MANRRHSAVAAKQCFCRHTAAGGDRCRPTFAPHRTAADRPAVPVHESAQCSRRAAFHPGAHHVAAYLPDPANGVADGGILNWSGPVVDAMAPGESQHVHSHRGADVNPRLGVQPAGPMARLARRAHRRLPGGDVGGHGLARLALLAAPSQIETDRSRHPPDRRHRLPACRP